jgi:hypothetical protein
MPVQVFSFPVTAPKPALVREDLDALSHLSLTLANQRLWCQHKLSVTISFKDNEWAAAGNWVYERFDERAEAAVPPYGMKVQPRTSGPPTRPLTRPNSWRCSRLQRPSGRNAGPD